MGSQVGGCKSLQAGTGSELHQVQNQTRLVADEEVDAGSREEFSDGNRATAAFQNDQNNEDQQELQDG